MDFSCEKNSKERKFEQEDDQDQPRSGMEILSHDVTLDILSRLSITSLIRFRFVNRAWMMLSYDPNLVELHFPRTARNNPCLIFHCDYPLRNHLYFAELSDEQQNGIARKIQTPFFDSMPEFIVVGSCNGLLCLNDSLYRDPLYVYNPFTREYKELPKSRQFDDQEVVFGFGFHPVTNEYKVVKIVFYWYHHKVAAFPRYRRFRIHASPGSEVQVYTLGKARWRSIGKVPYELEIRPSEAFVNGRLHWLTQPQISRGTRTHTRSIVCFDLADEQFQEVPRPHCGGLNRCNYHLAVLGGCLSAAVSQNYGRFEIWSMEEYNVRESWIKKFIIEDHSSQRLRPELQQSPRIWVNVQKQRLSRVLCLLKNGNVLIEYKGGVLVSHDPERGTFERLMFQGVPHLFQTVVHVGSLNCIDTPIHTITN